MNKIFKSIWNSSTRSYTAVSEEKRARKKTKSVLLTAATLGLVFASQTVISAEQNFQFDYGANRPTDLYLYLTQNPSDFDRKGSFNSNFFVGGEDPAREFLNISIWAPIEKPIKIHLNDEDASVNQGSIDVIEQSLGFDQLIVSADNAPQWGSNANSSSFQVVNDNSNSSSFTQTIVDNENNAIADATYLIGTGAVSSTDGIFSTDEYGSTGVHLSDNGISMAVILAGLNIQGGQTLDLSLNEAGSTTFGARLSGYGNVSYAGIGREQSILTIKPLINVTDWNGANQYTGSTTIKDITLNLERLNSFGTNANITAVNAKINTSNENAFNTANSIRYQNVDHNFWTDFTVTGDALFSGNNKLTATNGSSLVDFKVNGTMTVENGSTVISAVDNPNGAQSHVHVTTNDLVVNENASLDADAWLTVNDSLTLKNINGVDADTVQVGQNLNFVDISGGEFNTDIDAIYNNQLGGYQAISVSLENSTVSYAKDWLKSGQIEDTTLRKESSLTLNVGSSELLGQRVNFERGTGEARSELHLRSDGASLIAGVELHGDGLLRLDGAGAGTTTISLDNADDLLTDFNGWVRIENGSFTLNDDRAAQFNHAGAVDSAGLSIGSGGVVIVDSDTTVEMDKFGWQAGGVLDLSQFDFANGPALKVGQMSFANTVGQGNTPLIRVNPNEILNTITPPTGDTVFGYDNANLGTLLIQTTIEDDYRQAIEIQDANGNAGGSLGQTYFSRHGQSLVPPANNVAAVGTWTWNADYYDGDAHHVSGIYTTFSLGTLELRNGEADAVRSGEELRWDSAFLAQSSESAKILTSKVTGYGIFEVTSYGNTNDQDVYLHNAENDYQGATVVRENTTLGFTGTTDTADVNAYGSLGHSTLVLTGANANLLFEDSRNEGQLVETVQRITGIHTDANAHSIELREGTTLEVNGNAAANFDQTAQDKYGVGEVTLGDLGIANSEDERADLLASFLGEKTVFEGAGTLRLEGSALGSNTTNLVLGSADTVNHFNGNIQINDFANLFIGGDEVLNGGIFTTALGEAADNFSRNINLSVEAHVGSYTVGGETYDGADFSNYRGRVILDSPDKEEEIARKFIIHGDQGNGSIWWNDSGVLVGNGSILQLDNTQGRFTNSFTRYNPSALLSTIELVNGTNLLLDGTSETGLLSAAGIFDIDAKSSLTLDGTPNANGGNVFSKLGGTRNERPNLNPGEGGTFADANRFKGAGSLTLGALTLRDNFNGGENLSGDDYINVDDFTGTLSLTNGTRFTISDSRRFNTVINNGTTFAIESNGGVSLKDGDSWKSLSYSGDATLDLSKVQFDASDYKSAMLSVDALTEAAEGSKLTVNLGSNDPLANRTRPDILSQDEGWTALIIDAQRKDGTAEETDIDITVNGNSVAGDHLESLDLAEGVQAGYQAGAGLDENGDVGMHYVLKTLTLDNGSSLAINGDANAEPAARDLNVHLFGAGTLNIEGDVTINALGAAEGFEASSFTGTYDLAADSTLHLTGLGASTAAVDLEGGSTLAVDSDQNLVLRGKNKAADLSIKDGVGLTLHTAENDLGAGSTITGGENATIAFAKDAALHLSGANAALGNFAGAVALGENGVLHLDDTDRNGVSLDRITGAENSRITMTSGSYVREDEEGFTGAYQVGNAGESAQPSEAKLTLLNWGSDASAASFTNSLSGNGVVALQNSFVQIDDELAFEGTWDLGSSTVKDRLVVETDNTSLPKDGVKIGDSVKLGDEDELVFRTTNGLPSGAVKITTNVEGSGSFIVESGRYEVANGTSVQVAETDVVSGASLTVSSLNQLGSTVTADGTIVVNAGSNVVLGDKVLKTTDGADGARTLQINAGERGVLTIGDKLDYTGFEGQIRLASGTYTYADKDEDLWSNVGFAVGGSGSFVYAGADQIQLKAFSWDYLSDKGNGVLNIDGYAGSHEQAAIHAGTLNVKPGAKISIDLNDWIQNLDQNTGVGNVLDLDADENEGHPVWLVTGDVVTGTDGNLALLNNGQLVGGQGSSQTADIYSEPNGRPGSEVAATGVWDYGVDVVEKKKGAADMGGIRLSYALREIRMHEGQTLNITTADSSDTTLTARITDKENGKASNVVIKTGEKETIILNPVEYDGKSGNDFHGTLTLTEKSNLQTLKSSSLGTETDFTLEKGASFVMGSGAQDESLTERVRVTASDGAEITVNGNRLEMLDGSTFSASAVVHTGEETSYGGRSRLVSVNGDVTFADAAKTLADYKGLLTIENGASMTFAGGNAEETVFKLTNLEGLGTAVANRSVVIGDASAFGGTFEAAAAKTIFLDADSTLSSGTTGVHLASVKLNEGSVLDTSAVGKLTTIAGLTTSNNAVLKLGSIAMLGTDAASGAIRIESNAAIAGNTVIEAEIDPNRVSAENLLELDDGGKQTTLIELGDGVNADLANLKLELSTPAGEGSISEETQEATGLLYAGFDENGDPVGDALGDLTYGYKLVQDSDRIAVKTTASTLALYENAVLDIREAADNTLSLQLIGGKGTVRVGGEGNAKDVIFTGENSFGALNVASDSTLEIRADQTLASGGRIDGSVVSSGENAIRLGNDGAQLVLTKVQSSLKGGIDLGGGTLVLDGVDAENGFGTGWEDSLLASAVTGEGTVSIQGVTGKLDTQLGSAAQVDGVHLVVGGGSAVQLDRDNGAFAQSNLSDVVIGEDGDAQRSVLVVRSTHAGVAQSVDVDIRENGTLHYALTGLDAGVVQGNIGDLTGTGRLEIDLVDGSHETHEVRMNAQSQATGRPAFTGTFSLWRGKFVFGEEAGDAYRGNNELAQNVSVIEAGRGSLFQMHGNASVNGFNGAANSTIDFSFEDNSELLGKSDNLLTIADGGTFSLEKDAVVRVSTDGIKIAGDLNGSVTSANFDFDEILATKADETKQTFYQIVEGDIGSIEGSILADADGSVVKDDEFTIGLYDAGREGDPIHVADLVGGFKLVEGDGNRNLYLGQGINGAILHENIVLDGDVDITSQWLRSDDEDPTGFTVTSKSSVRLGHTDNSFTGVGLVEKDGSLVVSASGALGGADEGTTAAALNTQGDTTILQDVKQALRGLEVGETGSLTLQKGAEAVILESTGATVAGALSAESDSVVTAGKNTLVEVLSTADLSGMNGTFKLEENAQLKFTIDQEVEKVFTSGAVDGGSVLKTGAGALKLSTKQFAQGSASDIILSEGALAFEDWADTDLRAANVSIGNKAEAFVLDGDVKLEENGVFANDGTVRLQAEAAGAGKTASPQFVTRTINGDYTGNGSIVFNAFLGSSAAVQSETNPAVAYSEHADLLVVTGNATGTANFIVNNLNDEDVGKLERLALMEVGGSVDGFSTMLNGSVNGTIEAGGYSYYLTQRTDGEGNLSTGTDYVLTSYQGDDRLVSVNNGAYIGVAAAAQMFDLSIHDRMGTRPYINPITGEEGETSMWIRQSVIHERSRDTSGQLSMRNTSAVTQMGGDIVQLATSGGGYAFAGAMAGWGTEDWKTRSTRTDASSRADIDGWMVGVYGGWHQNDPKNDRTGAYVNGWLQFSAISADISNNADKGKVRADGLSASLEAGWNFHALAFKADGGATQGDLYVEPRAQVTWWGMEYDDMHMNGLVQFKGEDNVTTRLGVRTSLVMNGATAFVPFVEANWVHNTNAYGAQYGEVSDYQAGAENQAELKFGADIEITKNFTGYGQFTVDIGDDGYNRRQGSIGLKYRW